MFYCKNCGCETNANALYCPHCGVMQNQPDGTQSFAAVPVQPPQPPVPPQQNNQGAPAAVPVQPPQPPVPPQQNNQGAPAAVPVQPPQPNYNPYGNVNTPAEPVLCGAPKVFSIISLVTGIISLVSCYMGIVFGIAGLIFSIIAKNKFSGKNTMANLGFIFSIIGISLGIIFVVLLFVFSCFNGRPTTVIY